MKQQYIRSGEPRIPAVFFCVLLLSIFTSSTLWAAQDAASSDGASSDAEETAVLRHTISAMKANARGPFRRLRWFCRDGSILPPKANACDEHGGGVQHGQWSTSTISLRERGFLIANVLASIDVDGLVANQGEQLQQIHLEQFLVATDEGWIYRKAQFYRGAFQAEDEERIAKQLIKRLVETDELFQQSPLLVFETARRLAYDTPTGGGALIGQVRIEAARINREDPTFSSLRNKIHGRPDAGDADRVRKHAAELGKVALLADYEALASMMDKVTDPALLQQRLSVLAAAAQQTDFKSLLNNLLAAITQPDPVQGTLPQISVAALELFSMRGTLSNEDRVLSIETLNLLDQAAFTEAATLPITISRQAKLHRLVYLARMAYVMGLLSDAEWQQFELNVRVVEGTELALNRYRELLSDLARVPVWAQQRLRFHYQPSVELFSRLDPLAGEFIPDRLRGSSLLAYSMVLDALASDAANLAAVKHSLFGTPIATGLRSLNPGVAEGVLWLEENFAKNAKPGEPNLLVVPETLADLPPVAGILTENEGNHLSHVQLLARNLGIPNVVVGRALMATLRSYEGKPVSLASSPGGIVELKALNEHAFRNRLAQAQPEADSIIQVNVEKLELSAQDPISVQKLRGLDSGVKVGPKAAQLGELNYRYPGRVSAGLAVPFGCYRALLDQPFDPAATRNGSPSAFAWLKGRYARLASMDDAAEKRRYRNETLSRIRQWIMQVPLDPEFVQGLRKALLQEFGADGSYGVFVRSDTNVEDLPGFTGAGLNLTVPNVVGVDNILAAMRRVWASPFTERAFGWRQALMDKPEHLYVAVLLHQGVDSAKSGVLVGADVEAGGAQSFTVVINEGVGGGVEGQSAETLLVSKSMGSVKRRGSATAAYKRVLLKSGGSELVRAQGPDRLLTSAELETLRLLVKDLEGWFRDEGEPIVADVEFGFLAGELVLFQIRPFVESRAAANNQRLQQLDAPLRNNADQKVNLLDMTQ